MSSAPVRPPATPHAREKMDGYHKAVLDEVRAAIAAHDVVILGMAINPHPGRARRALDAAGIPYKYLGYGSYLGQWKPRLAIKLWSGWPTFPQVFVKGTLIGGADQLTHMIADGSLQVMLGAAPAPAGAPAGA